MILSFVDCHWIQHSALEGDEGIHIQCIRDVAWWHGPCKNTSVILCQRRLNQHILCLVGLGLGALIGLVGWMGYECLKWGCMQQAECFLYLFPFLVFVLFIGTMSGLLRLSRWEALQDLVLKVENNIAFVVSNAHHSMFLTLDTSQRSKTYQYAFECPISVLHCKWLAIRSYIKMACYTLPYNPALHVPVTCDVIDLLRRGPNHGTSIYTNFLGILVIRHAEAWGNEAQFITFLQRSGFTIVCNTPVGGTLIATRIMEGSGEWSIHQLACMEDFIHLELQLGSA